MARDVPHVMLDLYQCTYVCCLGLQTSLGLHQQPRSWHPMCYPSHHSHDFRPYHCFVFSCCSRHINTLSSQEHWSCRNVVCTYGFYYQCKISEQMHHHAVAIYIPPCCPQGRAMCQDTYYNTLQDRNATLVSHSQFGFEHTIKLLV